MSGVARSDQREVFRRRYATGCSRDLQGPQQSACGSQSRRGRRSDGARDSRRRRPAPVSRGRECEFGCELDIQRPDGPCPRRRQDSARGDDAAEQRRRHRRRYCADAGVRRSAGARRARRVRRAPSPRDTVAKTTLRCCSTTRTAHSPRNRPPATSRSCPTPALPRYVTAATPGRYRGTSRSPRESDAACRPAPTRTPPGPQGGDA